MQRHVLSWVVAAPTSPFLPASPHAPRPRIGAGYLIGGIATVLFGLFGVPIAMSGPGYSFGSPLVELVSAALVGPGAVLVIVGTFLLVKTGGPPRRPATMLCPSCGARNSFTSGFCEKCGRLLRPES